MLGVVRWVEQDWLDTGTGWRWWLLCELFDFATSQIDFAPAGDVIVRESGLDEFPAMDRVRPRRTARLFVAEIPETYECLGD